MPLFIKLFSVTGICLLICYAVGATVIRLFKLAPRERFFALFLSLVVGVSIVVGSYALICTHGDTIQTAIVALSLLVVWLIKKPSVGSPALLETPVTLARTGVSALPIAFVLTVVAFCLQYFILYDADSGYFKTPFIDYVYYSRLSLPLNHLGLETNSLEVIHTKFLTQQPYHYFEIWLNALLVRVTGLPSILTLFVSSTAVLLTIILVGFSAVFAHFQLRTSWVLVLSVLFLFVTGIKWPFLQHYNFVANGGWLLSSLLCLQPKLAPVYIFALLASLLLLNRHYVSSGAALAVLPLSFISTAPVAGIGVVVLAGYLLLTKQLPLIKAIAMVVPIVAATLCIALFYTLHPEPYQFPNANRVFTFQSIIPQLSEAKTLFGIAAGVLINYSIYFVAYGILLLFILVVRRQPRLLNEVPSAIWIWFGISLVTSAMMRAFGTHYLDSFQFFSNPMLPLTPVVLSILLAATLRRAPAGIYVLVTGSLVLLLAVNLYGLETGVTRYSPQFLQKISKAMPKAGYRGAYILANSDYKNAYMLSSDSYTAGNYISNFKNDYALISLSELDIDSLATDVRFKRDSVQAEQIVQKSTLYRFAKFQSLNQQRLSLDSIKYKLVTENSIGFICASKEAKLPAILQPLVAVMYTDALSGERFYLLKYRQGSVASTAYN